MFNKFFNKSNKRSHKQSEYFTIMLVPHSSGKTRSLRIPLMVFYMVTGIMTVSLLCFTSFVFATNHFRSAAETAYSELEQSTEMNSRLQQEKFKLGDLLNNKDRETEQVMQQQQESYEEIIHSYETYYKEKAEELEQKLEELDKAREEIYNIISKKSYLPKITTVSAPSERAETVFLSTGGSSGNIELSVASRYDQLDRDVDEWQIYFDHLMGELDKVRPYLDNYPTSWPVRGKVTSEHSFRRNPFGGGGREFHYGIDIVVPTGTNVMATGGGRVTISGWKQGYGYVVEISHGFGLKTLYAHNSRLLVKVGDNVSRGDFIARSGNTGRSTGPHVHYEVIQNNTSVNPRRFIEL